MVTDILFVGIETLHMYRDDLHTEYLACCRRSNLLVVVSLDGSKFNTQLCTQ